MATAVVDRMTDATIASFVANSVAAERGATERLAHAFEALVPETERRERLLQLAEGEARQAELGKDAGFEQLWQGAADMLKSTPTRTSCRKTTPRAVGRRARRRSRWSASPMIRPSACSAGCATVSETALRQLDLDLLLDLLRIENDPDQWAKVAAIVGAENRAADASRRHRRRAAAGGNDAARAGPGGRTQLSPAASATAARLSAGPLVRHVVLLLRKADDAGVGPLARLCHTIGPGVVRPLAEALATEDNNRAIRPLRELLLGFGAAGRQSVEQLKNSSNPAVRRTAIDLLRVFGGDEALPELASMLGDADPQVQRESIRAIVQIGTPEAYAVLERALVASRAAREAIVCSS